MTSTKKQFIAMYDEAVDLLKKFKQKNDSLNKSIGIEHDATIVLKINSQKSVHNAMIKKLEETLSKLEQSYLDPDTARKIGTVKQQYKIQKDRRSHLLQSLNQLQETDKKIMHETSESQNYIKYKLANAQQQGKNSKNFSRRENSDQQDYQNSTSYSINKQNEEQITEYDYEIECKLLNERNLALEETEKKLINVYNITKETKEMVDFQGEHLDIISDEIFRAKDNTSLALKQLKEANELSKKRNKKVFILSLFVILGALLIVGILFI